MPKIWTYPQPPYISTPRHQLSTTTVKRQRRPATFNTIDVTCMLQQSIIFNQQRNHACDTTPPPPPSKPQGSQLSALRVGDNSTNSAARNTTLPYYIQQDTSTCRPLLYTHSHDNLNALLGKSVHPTFPLTTLSRRHKCTPKNFCSFPGERGKAGFRFEFHSPRVLHLFILSDRPDQTRP